MGEPEEVHEISTQGEAFSSEFSFAWVNPGPIEAGEAMAPAKLASQAARVFAALHLILGDLAFAEECFNAANQLGIPNDKNPISKALIFAGVVSYARCFKSGVRALTLNSINLHARNAPFDDAIHEYIVALRDKHVAHSVNDFEQCEAIAIVVGRPGGEWRNGSAIGVVKKQSIGVSAALLKASLSHIQALRAFLEADLPAQRVALEAEFSESFRKTGKWEMAPILKLSDRTKVSDRRR